MKEKQNIEDILSKSNLKENPFGVPAGYFQKVQEEVVQKIEEEYIAPDEIAEPAPSTAHSFFTIIKPALSLAAVFAIIFGLGYGAMSLTNTLDYSATKDLDFTTISGIELPQGTEFTEEEIISIIGSNIEAYLSEEGDTVTVNSKLNKEDIEEYLIDCRVTSTTIAMLNY